MNQNFVYHGKVNVKIKKDNKYIDYCTVHNNGEQTLFNLLAKFLCGRTISDSELPYSINVYDANNYPSTKTVLVSNPIIATKSYIEESEVV